METLILVMHVAVAIVMVGLVLLQQGKGAEMGASFGAGSSQTVFGAAGAAGFLVKLTAVLAAVFFVTSLTLAIYARKNATNYGRIPDAPAVQVPAAPVGDVPASPVAPAAGDVPVTPAN